MKNHIDFSGFNRFGSNLWRYKTWWNDKIDQWCMSRKLDKKMGYHIKMGCLWTLFRFLIVLFLLGKSGPKPRRHIGIFVDQIRWVHFWCKMTIKSKKFERSKWHIFHGSQNDQNVLVVKKFRDPFQSFSMADDDDDDGDDDDVDDDDEPKISWQNG